MYQNSKVSDSGEGDRGGGDGGGGGGTRECVATAELQYVRAHLALPAKRGDALCGLRRLVGQVSMDSKVTRGGVLRSRRAIGTDRT